MERELKFLTKLNKLGGVVKAEFTLWIGDLVLRLREMAKELVEGITNWLEGNIWPV